MSTNDKCYSRGSVPSKTTRCVPLVWAVWLISLYVGAQIIADITAAKMVTVLGVALPGGTFIYAVTFTLSDFMQRKLGKKAADMTVVAAGVVNVLMALYFIVIIRMPYPGFWPDTAQEAFASTLAIIPFIVVASIIAEVVSGLVDNQVYHLVRQRPWLGMLLSNAVSVPLDSILFAGLAFVVLPMIFTGVTTPEAAHFGEIVQGQTLVKWANGHVVMPGMALIRSNRDIPTNCN